MGQRAELEWCIIWDNEDLQQGWKEGKKKMEGHIDMVWHVDVASTHYNEHISSLSSQYTCQCRPSSLPLVQCFHDNVTHTRARQVNMAAMEAIAWVSVMITTGHIAHNYFVGVFNTQLNRKVKTRSSGGLWTCMGVDTLSHCLHLWMCFIIITFNKTNKRICQTEKIHLLACRDIFITGVDYKSSWLATSMMQRGDIFILCSYCIQSVPEYGRYGFIFYEDGSPNLSSQIIFLYKERQACLLSLADNTHNTQVIRCPHISHLSLPKWHTKCSEASNKSPPSPHFKWCIQASSDCPSSFFHPLWGYVVMGGDVCWRPPDLPHLEPATTAMLRQAHELQWWPPQATPDSLSLLLASPLGEWEDCTSWHGFEHVPF